MILFFVGGTFTGNYFPFVEPETVTVEQEWCLEAVEGYRIKDSYEPTSFRITYESEEKSNVVGNLISIGDRIENINTGKTSRVVDIIYSFSGNQVYVLERDGKVDRWDRNLIMKWMRFADGN
jgi:hypothetical protein